MRVYVDASPVIYVVEQVAPFALAVAQRLAAPGVVIVASELTRLECLVRPLRSNDATLVRDFDIWFARQVAEIVPFTADVFRHAAEIRAGHGFKTPDALHLAAAVAGGCAAFLTNDAQLTRFPGLAVEVV
jgi:predicted nucleic acid-binding protein